MGPTQLLRVEKDAYDESLLKMHKIQHETRTEFLRDIFLFSDWEDTELARLAKVLTGKKYEKNTTIIKQGKTTDQMYFIVSGRCRVLKRMSLSNDLQDKLMSVRARASEVGLHRGNMTSSLGSSMSSTACALGRDITAAGDSLLGLHAVKVSSSSSSSLHRTRVSTCAAVPVCAHCVSFCNRSLVQV